MNFLDQFLTDTKHLILIGIITLIGFYLNFSEQASLYTALEQYLPIIIVVIIILYAAYKKKYLVSYFVLAMTFFAQSIYLFIQNVYNLLDLSQSLSWRSLLSFIVGLLLWVIITHLWIRKTYKWHSFDLKLLVPFFVFFLLFNHLSTVILLLILPIIGFGLGNDKIGFGLLLSEVIIYPIMLISLFDDAYTNLLLLKVIFGTFLTIYAFYLNWKVDQVEA